MKLSEHEPEINLQDAFEQFRKRKMQSIKQVKQSVVSKCRSTEEKEALRKQFLDLVHSHVGIPYARCNHPSNSDLFNAPYDLDCCALVRAAICKMQDQLGFKFGLWNQAYMFDTLPIRFDDVQQMKPGDLIFYEGKYVDLNKKPQKHDIVHVEIYDPTDENKKRCFASRWNDGVIQWFDSFEFTASNWKLVKIWFCSIDTWLDGVCTSTCPEHDWQIEQTGLSKKSIFYDESDYRAE